MCVCVCVCVCHHHQVRLIPQSSLTLSFALLSIAPGRYLRLHQMSAQS